MRRKNLNLLSVLAVLSLLAVGPLNAHSQDRVALEGGVFDVSGAPLPDATVFVKNLETGLEVSRQVDSQGEFSLDIRAGHYRVSAAVNDFQTASETVDLTSGASGPLVLKLAPAILTQSGFRLWGREESRAASST